MKNYFDLSGRVAVVTGASTGLAYQEYRAIPGVKVKYLDHVDYCQYNRCYYHSLGDPGCAMNERSMKEFRGWAAQAPLGLYGYEFDVFDMPTYRPLWRVIGDEMRVFRDMGLKRVKTEYSVNLNRLVGARNSPALPRAQVGQLASRLAYYAWAMAAFDPGLDMDALLDDFCRHVYGGAAEDMKAYHNLMADAWGGMKTHITYFGNSARGVSDRFITVELEKKARERLAAAASAAKGDERAASEVALDAECFDIWAKLAAEARRGGVALDLRVKDGDDAFNTTAWLVAKPKKPRKGGEAKPCQKTRFKICRGRSALRVLAECEEADDAFNRGTAKNDAHGWDCGSIRHGRRRGATDRRHAGRRRVGREGRRQGVEHRREGAADDRAWQVASRDGVSVRGARRRAEERRPVEVHHHPQLLREGLRLMRLARLRPPRLRFRRDACVQVVGFPGFLSRTSG